jgi:cation diffusion facilitator CzcD-associated flavoprotein CzcO
MPAMTPRHTQLAIVGSGLSGIAMARALIKSGREDFVILEKGNDVGGTWRDNTYPGIACDVPSNLYSFSFAPNPNWSRSYSGGREINDYVRGVAKKLGLLPRIEFNTTVQSANWDDDAQLWRIETSDGPLTSDFLISAMGPLSEPMIPELPGIENFKGEAFHSQQWAHGYDLKDKRVAVVGTGASAIQFVPKIQPEVAELQLYQRTAPWILPRSERKVSGFEHKLFKYLPFTQKLVRGAVYSVLELRVIAFVKQTRLMKAIEKVATLNLRSHIKDAELRKKVTPDFVIGCKRILMANDYYPAIAKENVDVITHGVTEVREHSIVADDGSEREVDAIIWGTGFHVTDNPDWQKLRGRDGRSLTETWAPTGMRAYLGALTPNFPNAFMIIGPNTTLGHNSMIYMIESCVEYIISVLDHVEQSGAASVEVKESTVADFEADMERRSAGTIWTIGGCDSWYLDANGRNTMLWPDYTFRFRKLCRSFEPGQVMLRSKGESEPTRPPEAVELTA